MFSDFGLGSMEFPEDDIHTMEVWIVAEEKVRGLQDGRVFDLQHGVGSRLPPTAFCWAPACIKPGLANPLPPQNLRHGRLGTFLCMTFPGMKPGPSPHTLVPIMSVPTRLITPRLLEPVS